jgi:hypothetical protein
MSAEKGKVEVLEKLWEWAKKLQLKPDAIWNEVFLSKGHLNITPWHMAAENDNVEVLEKLWEWAKELQIKPVGLKNCTQNQRS